MQTVLSPCHRAEVVPSLRSFQRPSGSETTRVSARGIVKYAQSLPGGALRPGGQHPAHQRCFHREEPDGTGGVGVRRAQAGEGIAQPDQAAVILHQPLAGGGALPAQLIEQGRGGIAVVLAFFGAGKLLAGLPFT